MDLETISSDVVHQFNSSQSCDWIRIDSIRFIRVRLIQLEKAERIPKRSRKDPEKDHVGGGGMEGSINK